MKLVPARLAILIAVAVSFCTGFYFGKSLSVYPPLNTYGDFEAKIERTRDGDTAVVEVQGDAEPVRYIGIDTPETKHPTKGEECFGKEAADKNKELVLGKTVRFERDKSNRDHRGRLLRYIWAGDKMVNLELVKEGYAFASHVSPNGKYRKQFGKAEEDAKSSGKGLWGACKVLAAEHGEAKQQPKKSHSKTKERRN